MCKFCISVMGIGSMMPKQDGQNTNQAAEHPARGMGFKGKQYMSNQLPAHIALVVDMVQQ